MRKLLLGALLVFSFLQTKAQVTTLAGDYKIIDIGDNVNGDYTRSVILLHEAYNGATLPLNYAIGTITALRGNIYAYNRIDVVNVNTSSSYSSASGTISSVGQNQIRSPWKLKTCIYAGKKYLAVEVPYGDAFHNAGFKFSGATLSSGENMKCISYASQGQLINQNLISEIQDFNSDMFENHEVTSLTITGNVGIGTLNPKEKLSVNGRIRAHEIKVESAAGTWPDYVFSKTYQLPPLEETEKHIIEKGHLPGIPSAKEVMKEGINLGEMNARLLQKIEELTLHLIAQDKRLQEQELKIQQLIKK